MAESRSGFDLALRHQLFTPVCGSQSIGRVLWQGSLFFWAQVKTKQAVALRGVVPYTDFGTRPSILRWHAAAVTAGSFAGGRNRPAGPQALESLVRHLPRDESVTSQLR